MALTPEVRSTQAGVMSVATFSAPELRATQAGVMSVVTLASPEVRLTQGLVFGVLTLATEEIRLTQGRLTAPIVSSNDIRVSQTKVMAVIRGRIANPRLRAWTFSLDGHDFYVLRLGDESTLVYDVYSEQWMDWSTADEEFWRVNTGMNWSGAVGLTEDYGSNVVVGDDTYGLLWFLDPEQPYDEDPDSSAPEQENYFERVVMGQFAVRGREAVPCYAAFLTTDMGDPAYTGAGVTLYTSDDSGETFLDHGLVTVTAGQESPQLLWTSLGQITAPGRLFKIVDDGAVARIDGLEMNDAG
jgi:hypothetical protein